MTTRGSAAVLPFPSAVGSAAEAPRWSRTAIVLHWLGAGLIAGMVLAGVVMSDLAPDSSLRLWLSRFHAVGGVTLIILTLARLWTRRRSAHPPPLDLPSLHRRGIAAIHGLMYVVMFALIASGFATARTSSHWHEYLVGDVVGAPDMSEILPRNGHEALVSVLLLLVVMHVVGVVINELRHGGTLRRMLPFLR